MLEPGAASTGWTVPVSGGWAWRWGRGRSSPSSQRAAGPLVCQRMRLTWDLALGLSHTSSWHRSWCGAPRAGCRHLHTVGVSCRVVTETCVDHSRSGVHRGNPSTGCCSLALSLASGALCWGWGGCREQGQCSRQCVLSVCVGAGSEPGRLPLLRQAKQCRGCGCELLCKQRCVLGP